MDNYSAPTMNLDSLLLLAIFLPIVGMGLANWALIDAFTVKNGSQRPTWFVIALSGLVNGTVLAFLGFRFQWLTCAPWIAASMTVIAVWRCSNWTRKVS